MAVPPFVTGKMQSNTLWPVISGRIGSSFFCIGRGILTGQTCIMDKVDGIIENADDIFYRKRTVFNLSNLPGDFVGNEDPVLEMEFTAQFPVCHLQKQCPLFSPMPENSHFF